MKSYNKFWKHQPFHYTNKKCGIYYVSNGQPHAWQTAQTLCMQSNQGPQGQQTRLIRTIWGSWRSHNSQLKARNNKPSSIQSCTCYSHHPSNLKSITEDSHTTREKSNRFWERVWHKQKVPSFGKPMAQPKQRLLHTWSRSTLGWIELIFACLESKHKYIAIGHWHE